MDKPLFKRTSLLQRILKITLRITMMFFMFIFTANALASEVTIQALQANQRVEISSWIEQKGDVAPGEQLDLYIKVATDHWFSGGTFISAFDIPNTLVMRRKKLANNYTERRNGQTWSIQEWQLSLYPQATGEYQIPAIPVTLHVVDKPGQNVSGTLLTQPIKFTVSLPTAQMTSDRQWISAPALTLEQSWSVEPERPLNVGDAITRTITMTGEDTTAMLFPEFPLATSDKLQSYQGAGAVKDSQNRGDFYATKTWEQTYIVQTNGEIELPEVSVLWWNTQSKQFTELELSSANWQVSHTPQSFIKAYAWVLIVILAIGFGLVKLLTEFIVRYQRESLPTWVMFVIANLAGKQPRINQYIYRRQFEAANKHRLREDGSVLTERYQADNKSTKIIEQWFSSQYSKREQAITWLHNHKVWRRKADK
ncbi:BatD family protein [Shewanella benthica]|uniref:BatD family protein n=1 Tax=Shewanella benthica TaxID=43661 RepID=UPI0018791FA6|nr:BatD family protein [Shewanella benthica]MBE7215941.1 BatD family protein [Shewanella benthica]MCL1063633.1 BatD family protein [Shewanella benthica]